VTGAILQAPAPEAAAATLRGRLDDAARAQAENGR